MFCAFDKANGKRVNILSDSLDDIKLLAADKSIVCPDCQSTLGVRGGQKRRNHFYHINTECTYPYHENETEEHMAGKVRLEEILKKLYPSAEVYLEYRIEETNQRSDVIVLHQNGEKWAFEFQCSKIPGEVWNERHELYKQAGVIDFWIFGGSMSKKHLNPLEEAVYAHYKRRYYLYTETDVLGIVVDKVITPQELHPSYECSMPLDSAYIRSYKFCTPKDEKAYQEKLRKEEAERRKKELYEKRIKNIERLMDKKFQAYLRQKWAKNIENELAWQHVIKYSNITDIDSVPEYLNQEIEGEVVFNCDRRIWQSRIFLAFVHEKFIRYKNPFPFKLQTIVEWVKEKKELPLNYPLVYLKDIPAYANYPDLTGVIYEFLCGLEKAGFVKCVYEAGHIYYNKYKVIRGLTNPDGSTYDIINGPLD